MNAEEEAIQMNILQIGDMQQVFLVAYLFQKLPVIWQMPNQINLINKQETEAVSTIESAELDIMPYR